MSDDLEIVRGSGNVWRDFNYPDADIRQAKSVVAAQIIRILEDKKLSTREAARRTGFAAADFSRIRNADFGRFTLDRLIRILLSLDRELEVELAIQPRTITNQLPSHAYGD
ncbi:MAG: helix-turn-helix transcriptional regulator [Candidatus Omnitrophota bacterium]